jgi:hypothetical protein
MTKDQRNYEREAADERIRILEKEAEAERMALLGTRARTAQSRRELGALIDIGTKIRRVAHQIADGVQGSADSVVRILHDR